MLKITDHRLEHCEFIQAADHGGDFTEHNPQLIILHYTAGSTFESAKTTLTTDDDTFVSSHLLIGRDGRIAQLVDFNKIAWHAGKSAYQGLESLNNHAIGIELVNPGYVRDGFTDGETIRATHKNGGPERDWFTYTQEQLLATVEVCEALFNAYPTICNVIGHDDCAPDRKVDPGPAFPWKQFNDMLYGELPSNIDRIDKWFTWNLPSADINRVCEPLYQQAAELARFVVNNTPYSAEQTIALRKLRECLMYCVSALTAPRRSA